MNKELKYTLDRIPLRILKSYIEIRELGIDKLLDKKEQRAMNKAAKEMQKFVAEHPEVYNNDLTVYNLACTTDHNLFFDQESIIQMCKNYPPLADVYREAVKRFNEGIIEKQDE